MQILTEAGCFCRLMGAGFAVATYTQYLDEYASLHFNTL